MLRELLALYEAGEISDDELGPWRLGPLPEHTPKPHQRIAEAIDLRVRLLLSEGITRALMYATSEPVRAGHVRTKGGASYGLNRLEADGVIRCVGEMPKLGKGNGTKLYVPPGWRPVDPQALEQAQRDRDGEALADLAWIPEPSGVPAQDAFPASTRSIEPDHARGVDQRQEPGENVPVLQAVAGDRREVRERDRRIAATATDASGGGDAGTLHATDSPAPSGGTG